MLFRRGSRGRYVAACQKNMWLHEGGKMGVSDTTKNGVKKGNPTVLTPYRSPQHIVLLTVVGHY